MWVEKRYKNAIVLIWRKQDEVVEHRLAKVNPWLFKMLTERLGIPTGVIKTYSEWKWRERVS